MLAAFRSKVTRSEAPQGGGDHEIGETKAFRLVAFKRLLPCKGGKLPLIHRKSASFIGVQDCDCGVEADEEDSVEMSWSR